MRQILHRQPQMTQLDWHNHLQRLSCLHSKVRAQTLMTLHQSEKTRPKCLRSEGPMQTRRQRNEIGRASRLELIEEPETLLGKGERKRLLTRGW